MHCMPTTAQGRDDGGDMNNQDHTDFEERLAAAPERLTRRDIADLTGRSLPTVRKWVAEPGFPAALPEGGPRGTTYYGRDEVAAWVRDVADDPHRRGDRLTAVPAPSDPAGRLTTAALAERYGITRRAVNYYAKRYQADHDDPFPAVDGEGLRDAREVDAWLRRHRDKPSARGNRTPRDQGRRDEVAALVAAREAAGGEVTSAWLAGELGIHPLSARRLIRQLEEG